ncbi:hypothetical protein GS580_05655 [Rhodococcus hoagii]|nr:hypothetical protein [Prescottella equi]
MALTSAGVVVVGNGGGQPSDAAIVDELLAGPHSAHPRRRDRAASPRLAPLLRSGAALVVVASARAEPLSRMRDALTWVIYSRAMELDVWNRTEVVESTFDPDRRRWTVVVDRDGTGAPCTRSTWCWPPGSAAPNR